MHLLELFTVGTWLFWVLFAVLSIMAMVFSEREEKGWLVFGTIVFLLVFGKDLVADFSIKAIAIYLSGYVFIGMIWSVCKWWLHVRKVSATIKAAKPDDYRTSVEFFRTRLDPIQNKGRLTTWGVYWPWSMLWSAVHDTVDAAFEALLSTYKKISGGALKDLQDLESRVEEARKR